MYENFCACLSFHYLCAANRCYARARIFFAEWLKHQIIVVNIKGKDL